MTDAWLRVRALLDSYRFVLAFLVVLVVAAGVAGTYAVHVDPGTERVERTTSTWGTTESFDHRASVSRSNSLYPVESTLRNRSVYFHAVTPRLDGAYRFQVNASDSGRLDERISLEAVIQGYVTRRGEENATVIWESSEQLESVSRNAVSANESVAVPFSVNVTALRNRAVRIDEELGRDGGSTRILVRATVHAEGTVNGEPASYQKVRRLRIRSEGGTYRIVSAGPWTRSNAETGWVLRERSYGPLYSAGGPILLVVGLGGAAGLVLAHRRDSIPLNEAERARLSFVADRNEFDEWISEIQLPPQAFELPTAEASSLGSLVDFAIDTDNGVVAAPDEEAFYVVHDGYLYEYRPPDLDEGVSVESGDDADDSASVDLDEARRDERERDEEAPTGVATEGAED